MSGMHDAPTNKCSITPEILRESLLVMRHDVEGVDKVRNVISNDWVLFDVDLRGVERKSELHQIIAKSCRFPSWYGAGWDALKDLLDGVPDEWLECPRSCLWIHAQELREGLLENLLGVVFSTLRFRQSVLCELNHLPPPPDVEKFWLCVVCVVDSNRTDNPGIATETRNFGGCVLIQPSTSPQHLLGTFV